MEESGNVKEITVNPKQDEFRGWRTQKIDALEGENKK